ncbi:MAG: CHAT domain-containing protein, partial [Chloroflexi bacterium]|nr:CHAT domain-containing protein [Chloroflexota bacterium]
MFELLVAGTGVQHQYVARVPAAEGRQEIASPFEWRSDSVALAMDLAALERAAATRAPPEGDAHVRIGRQLFAAVLGATVGEHWEQERRRAGRRALRLVLRIDPGSARELLNLPWEYLHDGQDFFALNRQTPLYRMPWGIESEELPALGAPLRLLVVIAAPTGLGRNMVLNSAREEDLILAATAGARRLGQVEVIFAANGSMEGVKVALRDHDPHILHFTGHGIFDRESDTGRLLMEAVDGSPNEIPNQEFVRLLLEHGSKSLRLVFLSACQSAVVPRQDGYADLGRRLLSAGIPAAVAMQSSMLDRSAM